MDGHLRAYRRRLRLERTLRLWAGRALTTAGYLTVAGLAVYVLFHL
jgi:hypothetical protein